MRFSTAPGVLVAMPQLADPNFTRSVVVMIEHDPRGALGVVVNQTVDHGCAEVCAELGLEWPGAPTANLLRGGPVEPQGLWMLHDDGWGFAETMRVTPGVAVSRSREALERMCAAREAKLSLLVGYAGWGGGQLEQEILQGSWLVTSCSAELVFEWPREEVWQRALHAMGVDPAHLVCSQGGLQ
ncbi:MAG: YqgE/AlgH family protein [Bradymonadia bacterium]|jgi:putative transcriptional regulator